MNKTAPNPEEEGGNNERGGGKKVRVTLWIYEQDKDQLVSLAKQRKREDWSELARDAIQDGLPFIGIKGEPDKGTGNIGNLSPDALIEQVYNLTGQGLLWLERKGISIATPSGQLRTLLESLLSAGTASPAASPPSAAPLDTPPSTAGRQAKKPRVIRDLDEPEGGESLVI